MKSRRKITVALGVTGILTAGVIWFDYGHMPGYEHLSPRDLFRIRQAVHQQTTEPIVKIIPDGAGAVRVLTGRTGTIGLDGGGIEYQVSETSRGWEIVGHSGWMSEVPNQRRGVDEGWPLLFAFAHSCPRATHADRSVMS